ATANRERRQAEQRDARHHHREACHALGHQRVVTTSMTVVGYGCSARTRLSSTLSASGTKGVPSRSVSPISQAAVRAFIEAGRSRSAPMMLRVVLSRRHAEVLCGAC